MLAFQPNGPILSIAAAANSNAAVGVAVQLVPSGNVLVQQVKLVNTDGTNDAIVGWGATAAEAAFNALTTNGSPKCTWLVHSTIEVITVPANCWMTAILNAGTPTVKVQTGYGN